MSLHAQATNRLREIIISGEFGPGDPLPEIEISNLLGMSRTPVRVAFRTLAAEGLVSYLPNRTAAVSKSSLSDALDTFDVARLLETLAVKLACRKLSYQEIRSLNGIQEQMEAGWRDESRGEFLIAYRKFHDAIVEGSRSNALISSWRVVSPRAWLAQNLVDVVGPLWSDEVRLHRDMLAALERRDFEAMACLVHQHFDLIRRSLLARSCQKRS